MTVRNNTEGSCIYFTQFSPKVTSSIIIVQNNTKTRKLTSIIYWSYLDFTSFIYTHLFVCVFILCDFIIWVFVYFITIIKIRRVHHYQDPLCCYFLSIGPISNPWEPLICSFSFQEYYINFIACNLMGLAFSLNIITLGPNPSYCMYQFCSFL